MQSMTGMTAAALLAVPLAAGAADLGGAPARSEPVVFTSPITWTGCGIGIQGGLVSSNTNTGLSSPGFGTLVSFSDLGGTGQSYGLSVTCDVQMGKIVGGIFADYNWYNEASFTASIPWAPASAGFGLDKSWSVGGRLGYLLAPQTLGYGLVAYSRLDMTNVTASGFGGTVAFSVPAASGYQLGGGVEHALTQNWHLKLEYRYGKYETQTVTLAPGLNLNLEPTVQSVLLGASYRF